MSLEKKAAWTNNLVQLTKSSVKNSLDKEASTEPGMLGCPVGASLISDKDMEGSNSIFNGETPGDEDLRKKLVERLKEGKPVASQEYKDKQQVLDKSSSLKSKLQAAADLATFTAVPAGLMIAPGHYGQKVSKSEYKKAKGKGLKEKAKAMAIGGGKGSAVYLSGVAAGLGGGAAAHMLTDKLKIRKGSLLPFAAGAALAGTAVSKLLADKLEKKSAGWSDPVDMLGVGFLRQAYQGLGNANEGVGEMNRGASQFLGGNFGGGLKQGLQGFGQFLKGGVQTVASPILGPARGAAATIGNITGSESLRNLSLDATDAPGMQTPIPKKASWRSLIKTQIN